MAVKENLYLSTKPLTQNDLYTFNIKTLKDLDNSLLKFVKCQPNNDIQFS